MKLINIEKVHSGAFINRYNLSYETRNGNEKIYEIVSHDKSLCISNVPNVDNINAVIIVAVNNDFSKICINKEFRLSVNSHVFNLPAGMVDKNETIEVAANRELYEETGLKIKEILHVMQPAYSAIGVCNERTAIVFCIADECEFAPSQDETEEIEPVWLTENEAKEIADYPNCTARTQLVLSLFGSGLFKNYIDTLRKE